MGTEQIVVVTGGGGRLGRLLVEALRADGIRVNSLSRAGGCHADDVMVDLRDAEAVAEVIGTLGAAAVVHLASVLHGEGLVEQNRLIDEAVAAASRRSRTPHVVNVSSGAVYGTGRAAARREGHPLAGTSAYARSKVAGEQIFRALSRGGVTRVTTLRVFNVAGPAFPDSLVMRLLNASPEDPVSVIAPDEFVRDYIHQSDVIAILRSAALSVPGPMHRVLNAAGGAAISTRMLLERLEVSPGLVVELPGAASSNWADIARLAAALGVRPHVVPTREWAGSHLSGDGG